MKTDMRKTKRSLTTTQVIMLGFLFTIAVGSGLLALPISAADGVPVPYVDALFTATTATCVTGLVTLPTFSAWSSFGQVVILLLIQIGGLGVVTILSGLMLMFHRRIGITDRLLIQDAFNLNTMSGLVRFVKKVICGTLIIEGVGALLYMIVFIPQYSARGIWLSVFTAISAFCNAGIDLFGADSLCRWAVHPLINAVTCGLIVLGGLGYIVWWDVLRVLRHLRTRGLRCLRELTLHSKIVLSATALLIFGGAALFLLLEWSNPLTMEGRPLWEKLQLAVFQSVTTRTAGFFTLPQKDLTDASALLSLLLMFIGGSPVGTAGGVKTVTFAVLLAYALSMIRGREEVGLWGRSIPRHALSKAVAVTGVSFVTMFTASLLLAAVTDAPALDILYETVSATATVGLTRDLTPSLNVWGKLIITSTMYLGRVGPISLAVAFNVRRKNHNSIKNPVEDISVG